MKPSKRTNLGISILLAAALLLVPYSCCNVAEKIGVIFVVHGGMDYNTPQYMWDAAVHQFSYDPNHSVYKLVIWNSANWPMVLDTTVTEFAKRFLLMYQYAYALIGGTDPYQSITFNQLADMKAALEDNPDGFQFEVDWASWMAPQYPEHYPWPRFLYTVPPDITPGPIVKEEDISGCTYCGQNEPDGPWDGCDPERYNVDGPAERLLKKGVSRIIMIDLTVGGVRFSKTFDVVEMTRRVVDNWNAENNTSVDVLWVNDYTDLMKRSYPTAPAGWTRSLKEPETDADVPLEGSPNPVAEDPELAELVTEGIEAVFSDTVPDNETGVVLFNHALHEYNEYFDPKMNDTVIINNNVRTLLLERHPNLDPANIVGAYGGIKLENPENGLVERVREMRGETYGYAWLYQSEQQLPEAPWDYRYWEAFEYLKNRGVKHIAIGFPQVVNDNVLNLVELANQFGKEIGIKTWAHYAEGDFDTYPTQGHPFADYWGVWLDKKCGPDDYSAVEYNCCYEMGGCADGRPYPPPRQTPIDKSRQDLDQSLGYDMSAYGQLGYDPAIGPPDADRPVQDQYTGTWEIYRPPNDDPRVGKLLARHVLNAARGNLD